MAKVIYYNIDDNLDYENQLLQEWGIADIELIEIKDAERATAFTEAVQTADGLVVEYDQVTAERMEKLPNLKIVALQSIGFNNVDIDAATEHGVCVTNIPGFCTEEVATHTIGMLLDLTRKITYLDRSVRAGQWNPLLGYELHRLTGKTFGMVFFGSIPKAMMPILKALGLNVLVYAPTKTKEFLAEYGAEEAETLDELLENSDFVSMHCPLNEVTTKMMGAAQFAKMKDSAFFINTARGGVVDEPALVEALKTGAIMGAAVDVIADEASEKSDLFALENTVITPHAAFMSVDAFYNGRKLALEQLVQRLSKKETPTNLVNKNLEIVF